MTRKEALRIEDIFLKQKIRNPQKKKSMKKKILLLCTVLLCFLLAGCKTSLWYDIKLDNGEVIKVALDTTKGLKLTQKNGQFKVKKGKKVILDGAFVDGEQKNKLVSAVYENSSATVVKDNNDEFVWKIKGEYNRIVNLPGAEVYALVASVADEDVAEKTYHFLHFEVVKGNGKEKVEKEDTSISSETDSSEEDNDASSVKEPSTSGEEQALNYAEEVVLSLSLSRKGLLNTMETNSESMPDATMDDYEYAIDYMEKSGYVDWELEAQDRANEYLNDKPDYNKEDLKEQLIMGDDFTESEAQYAVDNTIFE